MMKINEDKWKVVCHKKRAGLDIIEALENCLKLIQTVLDSHLSNL